MAQAALDVFSLEPPETPECQALVQHPSVICTPHLGASTTEALEGVAIEVVEAVSGHVSGGNNVMKYLTALGRDGSGGGCGCAVWGCWVDKHLWQQSK